jgi:hypothetical protein
MGLLGKFSSGKLRFPKIFFQRKAPLSKGSYASRKFKEAKLPENFLRGKVGDKGINGSSYKIDLTIQSKLRHFLSCHG